MNHAIRFAIISLILFLAPVDRAEAHSFSTSFLTVERLQRINYQISFHDLAVLNSDWIQEGQISRTLLNNHLDNLANFLNRTVTLSRCEWVLHNQRPWSTATQAKQQYLVLHAQTNCERPIESVTINGVWDEFPDHRVVVEQQGESASAKPRVLDSDNRTFNVRP